MIKNKRKSHKRKRTDIEKLRHNKALQIIVREVEWVLVYL